MEKFFSKVAAFGVTSGVFQIACKASKHHGCAAFTSGLKSLGGPLGMKGGLMTLGLVGIATEAISEQTVDLILKGVVKQLCREGESQEEIFSKIDEYHVSSELKDKLKNVVRQNSCCSIMQ